MYSQPSKQNISDEINKMIEKNALLQAQKHDRKEAWRSQTLVQSLYNGENNLPSINDINQAGYDLEYYDKGYPIGDCYLLAVLMGLVNQRPEFIKNTLIKEKNENEVEVTFHGVKVNTSKLEIENGDINLLNCEPDGKTYTYSVTKEEAIKWKTAHKALWPAVIEIALAKYSENLKFEYAKAHPKEFLKVFEKNVKTEGDKKYYEELKNAIENGKFEIYITKLREQLNRERQSINSIRRYIFGGCPTEALTNLTGNKAFAKLFNIKNYKSFGKFKINNYTPMVLQEYNYIKDKLKSGKVVMACFFHPRKGYSELFSKDIIDLTKSIRFKNKEKIESLLKILDIKQEEYLKWLKIHNIADLDALSELHQNYIIESIIENLPSTLFSKISKTKQSIFPNHSYTVTNAFEYGGYKYITFRNPHQRISKVYYDKSTKLPNGIDLPKDILNNLDDNEFAMELNHFYKYVDSLDYEL